MLNLGFCDPFQVLRRFFGINHIIIHLSTRFKVMFFLYIVLFLFYFIFHFLSIYKQKSLKMWRWGDAQMSILRGGMLNSTPFWVNSNDMQTSILELDSLLLSDSQDTHSKHNPPYYMPI